MKLTIHALVADSAYVVDDRCLNAAEPNGTACTDPTDICQHGTCNGSGTCMATDVPATTCLDAAKTQLAIAEGATDAKDKLAFKWTSGPPLTVADFGNPLATDTYTPCVYDQNGVVTRAAVPPGGLCSGKACWSLKASSLKYKDKLGTHDGIDALTLKASLSAKSAAQIQGKGTNLPDPSLQLVPPVTTQLFHSGGGVCLNGTYAGTQIRRNDAGEFSAKSP